MFDLTSEFGDIYEGHIIRINKEKLVLLLASAYHSNIQLNQSEDLRNDLDDDLAHLDSQLDPVYIHFLKIILPHI